MKRILWIVNELISEVKQKGFADRITSKYEVMHEWFVYRIILQKLFSGYAFPVIRECFLFTLTPFLISRLSNSENFNQFEIE